MPDVSAREQAAPNYCKPLLTGLGIQTSPNIERAPNLYKGVNVVKRVPKTANLYQPAYVSKGSTHLIYCHRLLPACLLLQGPAQTFLKFEILLRFKKSMRVQNRSGWTWAAWYPASCPPAAGGACTWFGV